MTSACEVVFLHSRHVWRAGGHASVPPGDRPRASTVRGRRLCIVARLRVGSL